MAAKKRNVRKRCAARSAGTLIPERIAPLVVVLRREKVLLDSDLANLYGVTTGALNQAVKRNSDRFPDDFMFQLTEDEAAVIQSLRSQTVTLRRGAHRKYRPYAFTIRPMTFDQGEFDFSSVRVDSAAN